MKKYSVQFTDENGKVLIERRISIQKNLESSSLDKILHSVFLKTEMEAKYHFGKGDYDKTMRLNLLNDNLQTAILKDRQKLETLGYKIIN